MKLITLLSSGMACLLLLPACGKKNTSTPFDRDVTAPLIDSHPTSSHGIISTAFCSPNPQGAYSTTVNGAEVKYGDAVTMNQGHSDQNDYDFGEGGACANRSIRETLAGMVNPDFFHLDGTTNFDLISKDSATPLQQHYVYHYHVSNSFPLPSVDWTVEWYFTVTKGTMADPQQVVLSYQKTNGTKYIDFWQGTATLDFVSENITSITVGNHIRATRQGPDDARDTANSIIAKARSESPNWDAIGGQNPSANPGQPALPPGDPNTAPSSAYCKPNADGPYHAEINGAEVHYGDAVETSNGHDAKGNFDYGLGGACVERPIREVWAALQTQASFKWARVTNFTVNDAATAPGAEKSYQINYTVGNFLPFLNTDWTMDWDFAVTKGTAVAPQQIVVTYKKTDGSSHIKLWEGTITLDLLASNITAITASDHLSATWQNPGTAEGNVKEMIEKARDQAPNWDAVGGETPASK